jgi:hypothetical protein
MQLMGIASLHPSYALSTNSPEREIEAWRGLIHARMTGMWR